MTEIKLYPMKEIRIIIQGEHVEFVTELLDDVEVGGYTIISNLSGKGEHGVHTAHSMFNDMDSMQMVISILPEEKVDAILAGLKPIFHRYMGIVLVADVSVSRPEHFTGKPLG
ncbi:MAG: P-II family nitrogen regulator [Nitrospiria bacterium]